jgi:hypothetical protein
MEVFLRELKYTIIRSKLTSLVFGVALASLLAGACGNSKPVAGSPAEMSVVPMTPVPMPGHASVSGVVRDGAGTSVAGATIRIAETDATTMTDEAGTYTFMVPADSTLTFVTTAPGFAASFHESIVLADGATTAGFDVMLLPTADVARIDALGAADQAATRGLMAVRLHSMNPACVTAGARVTVWPPLAATVVYSRPSGTGDVDQPDPSLTNVQSGAHVDLWLVGAIPPGNMFGINVEQAGCATADQAPSLGGLQLTGLRHVDVQSLSEVDVFLQ